MTSRHSAESCTISWWLIAAFFLMAFAPGVRAGQREDARAALARAEAALERGDPRTARVELMNAIRADPALGAARVAQARALLILGDGKAAGEELERAMALGVAPDAVRHLAARAALLRGDAQGALKEARATGGAPHRRASLARIEGQALGALGRYGEAAEAFERALALSPRDAAVWSDMARLEMARGNVAAALSAADRAFALAPGDADVLALRAMLARSQYGLEAAASWFEKALARAPDNVEILVDYAATLADLGRAGRALVLTRRALALSPGLPRAYLVQAIVAARAGRYDLARALLRRTGGALDGEPATRLLRGVLHLHAGNATLASDEFAPLLAEQPLNLRVRVLLARARYDARQYAEAEKVLFPIVERDDAGSYALTLSARIHEALGDRAAAGAFLSRAAALAPGRPGVFRGAGELPRLAAGAVAESMAAGPNVRYIRALLEAGQTEMALLRATALARTHVGFPEASLLQGDCLMAAGRLREGAAAYRHSANMRFDENVAFRLIEAWQRIGDRREAARVLGLLLAQNPMNVDGQRLAASLLLADGEYDRALAVLSALQMRLGNEDALLMADIARAYVGMGKARRALPYAAHAWRLMPGSAVASDIFGWAVLKASPGDARALELLEKAQSLAPHEPLVKLHLGLAYAAFGKRDHARIALREAARSPGFARRQEALDALTKL